MSNALDALQVITGDQRQLAIAVKTAAFQTDARYNAA